SWLPTPQHFESSLAEHRESARIAAGREHLGVQARRADDLDAGEVPEQPAHLPRVFHDDEQAPRLAVPPAAHLAATGPDVAALLRPLDVRKHAEAIEDLDALPGGAPLRLEGLEPILDDDGEAQILIEMVAARRDALRFIVRGQGCASCHPTFLLDDLF